MTVESPPVRPLFPLTSVRLKNFRAFKDLDFKPHPRLTVLFGRNASGKSSLLDAIAAGVSVITEGLPGVDDSNGAALSRRDIRAAWQAGKVLTEHRLRIELKAQGDIPRLQRDAPRDGRGAPLPHQRCTERPGAL